MVLEAVIVRQQLIKLSGEKREMDKSVCMCVWGGCV